MRLSAQGQTIPVWGSAIEVKDEQLPLLIKTEYGREMASNATTRTEKSNPSWHAQFGLVGAAAMHDLHMIQGPNVMWENSILCIPCIRDGRLKISAKSSQDQTILEVTTG